jgi:hypothetical protein
MTQLKRTMRNLAWFAIGCGAVGSATAQQQQQPNQLLRVNCAAPPVYHCPDSGCLGPMVTQPGDTVEPKTRRTFFLDCPSDYKAGEKVNIVLSLHGGGSYANWQRNYFPVMDFKDKHKLVVITPGSPTRAWTPEDDQYLHNIVDLVVGTVGKQNVGHFILAGHSQGGATSRRIVCSDYFKDKVDVRISLSGGREGETTRPAGSTGGIGGGSIPVYRSGEPQPAAPTGGPAGPAGAQRGPAPQPACDASATDYSFIYAVGEYENIPTETSPRADKYGCGKRVQLPEVIDPKPGYVWDSTRQDPGSDSWGHYPRSGRAQVFQFPNCKDGRVVADVVKLKKGHTEGYEPNVTNKILELALSSKGGKIANGKWTPPAPPAPPSRGAPGGTTAAPQATQR